MKHRIPLRVLLLLLLPLGTLAVQAQELKVTPLKALMSDLTARRDTTHTDNNGTPCALIKVSAPQLEDIKFTGSYIKEVNYDAGVYYLWVAAGMKKLTYQHPKYVSGEVEFESPVESKTVYMIVIQAPDSQIDTEALQRELETAKQDAVREIKDAVEQAKREGVAEAKAEAKAQALAEEEARAKAEAKAQAKAERKARAAENGLPENGMAYYGYGQLGSLPGAGIGCDLCFGHLLMGAEMLYPLGSSETLYWNQEWEDYELSAPAALTYKPTLSYNAHLGISLLFAAHRLRLTPMVGVTQVCIQGQSSDEDLTQTFNPVYVPLSLQLQVGLSKSFALFAEGAYNIPVFRGDIYTPICNVSETMAGWTSGIAYKIGISLYLGN